MKAIKVYSILVLVLMVIVIFSDIVTAQEFENKATSVPLYTLVNVAHNETNNYAINISEDDPKTNYDAWDSFKDDFGLSGKLYAPEMLPSSYDIDGTGGYEISSMLRLPSAYFMQGVQTAWIRTPIEWFNGMQELTVTINLVYNPADPFSFNQLVFSNIYDLTSPSIQDDIPGISTDVKVNQFWIPPEGDYDPYEYDFLYIRVNAPLYSDLTYLITYNTGTDHPRALFTTSDNGLDGLRWSNIDGEDLDVCASMDILGLNGFSDGIGGFFCPAGTSLTYVIESETDGDYFTLFIPFANAFTGEITVGSYWATTINDPDKAYYLESQLIAGVGVITPTITIEFYTDNYIWLRDVYYPFNDIDRTVQPYLDDYMIFDNLGWQEKIYFPIWLNFQRNPGPWVNTELPTIYIYDYVYDTTYIRDETKATLNKDSIYYSYYQFGEYVFSGFEYLYEKGKEGVQIIWNHLPDDVKAGLLKLWEFGQDLATFYLDFGNWMLEELKDLSAIAFSVGLEIWEWVVDHVPALQNILTKLLRVVLAVGIIALFVSIVYVLWKFLNTFRILATGGLEEAIEYASAITLYQDIGKVVRGGIDIVT